MICMYLYKHSMLFSNKINLYLRVFWQRAQDQSDREVKIRALFLKHYYKSGTLDFSVYFFSINDFLMMNLPCFTSQPIT